MRLNPVHFENGNLNASWQSEVMTGVELVFDFLQSKEVINKPNKQFIHF